MSSGEAKLYIGIGASAGGLNPIQSLFDHLNPNSDCAFIIVQHMSPDYKSMLDDLVARHTSMTVSVAQHGMPVEKNHVYINPPDKILELKDGVLYLQPLVKDHHKLIFPIDLFMHSLAEDQMEKAIGVILSGTGSDGTAGMRSIKDNSGIVIIQDEKSAQFTGMPQSVLEANLTDFVLPPKLIAEKINQLAITQDSGSTQSALVSDTKEVETEFERVLSLLKQRHNLDFNWYKEATLSRRIARRMLLNQQKSLSEYINKLEASPTELALLFYDSLIGVTSFFRDPEAFEILKTDYLPDLIKAKAKEEFRAWVAGCSTGEEAYTLAILVKEAQAAMGLSIPIKIFATDANSTSIQIASMGRYPKNISTNIPTEYLNKYFHLRGDFYEVIPEIRAMVLFANHNILEDAPFTNTDLVCCRNLLIYLKPDCQKRVLETLRFALRNDGVLFLGPSESTELVASHFKKLHSKWKIFKAIGQHRVLNSLLLSTPFSSRVDTKRSQQAVNDLSPPRAYRKQESVRERLLDQLSDIYCHDALIVNQDLEILYNLGNSSRFLVYPKGEMSNDISKLIIPDLKLPVTLGLRKSLSSNEQYVYSNIQCQINGLAEVLDVRITKLPQKNNQDGLVGIFFERQGTKQVGHEHVKAFDLPKSVQEQIDGLENELQQTKESLQATVEELETTNEELQSSNEELMASNEELQSTNEELQSVNEELHTVNTEYQDKIKELSSLNEDLDNIISSSEVATVFLDENGHVRRYTPFCRRLFKLIPSDIGRSFYDINHYLLDFSMKSVIEKVEHTGQAFVSVVESEDHHWYLLRVLPYKNVKTEAGQILITFVDISPQKKIEQELIDQKEEAEAANQAKSRFLSQMSHELRTPLNAILGFTQLLQTEAKNSSDHEMLSLIRSAGGQLLSLIDELLDLSHIESGKMTMEIAASPVNEIIESCLRLIQSMAQQYDVTITTDIDNDVLNTVLMTDRKRLKQVLINFVSNAIKYGKKQGDVLLKAELLEDSIFFSVKDDGEGLSSAQQAVIFNEFERLHHSNSNIEGSGIGLSICKKIVRDLKGELGVDSTPGQGAKFWVKLPLNKNNLSQQEKAASKADQSDDQRHESENPDTPYKTVLYVEDDTNSQQIISKMLSPYHSLKIETADSAKEAFDFIEKHPVDLLLVDLNLPDQKGTEFFDQLKESMSGENYIPAIMVSASVLPEQIDEARQHGILDYIKKPVDREVLIKTISKYLPLDME